jgi:organic hydroperoxide reductase OsmC/OhrA
MSEEASFTLSLEQGEGYAFTLKFDKPRLPELLLDEPPPLGELAGPNASRLLAAAAANCLSASLLFCLGKQEPPDGAVRTTATCRIGRNDKGRLRVLGMTVDITVNGALEGNARMARCREMFEDFCVVTASIRQGIPVAVNVRSESGALLHHAG